jgi:hypothetical protein
MQFERRQADKNFEVDGGKVLYALDNDVITIVTAPWRLESLHYLHQLLDDDDKGSVEALGHVLAEYFLAAPRYTPFVIIRPAENELEGMWNAVYLLAKDDDEQLTEGLEQILHELHTAVSPDEKHLFGIIQGVLQTVYGVSGPLTELGRISRVQQSGSIRRMDVVVSSDGTSPFPTESEQDEKQILTYEQQWLTDLNHSRPWKAVGKPGTGAPTNNAVDAAVLGRLEWINRHYINNNDKIRLCLVTGDTHIEKVASQRSFGNATFASQFIRNPDCFLSDDDFSIRAGLESTQIEETYRAGVTGLKIPLWDWIPIVFPPQGHPLSDFASKASQKNIVTEANRARQQFTRYITASAATSNRLAQAVNKHLEAVKYIHILEVRQNFEELKEAFSLISQDALTRFGISGALAGFWSLDYRNRRVERSIPYVKFDSLPKAAAFVQRLRDASSFQDIQHQVGRSWIDELKSDDKAGYITLIVFALAFASAGEWQTALTIGRAAVAAATQYRARRDSDTTIKGDEAAYLCAVFSRLTAKDKSGLENAKKWLDEAERRQKEPPIRASLKDLDVNTYRDPRFRAESLAIRLSQRLFAEMESERRQTDMATQSALTWDPAKECEKYIEAYEAAESESVENIRTYVLEQLAINFLQWQLLALAKNGKDSRHQNESKKRLTMIERSFSGTGGFIADSTATSFRGRSALVYFIYLCATAAFAPEMAGWNRPELREIRSSELQTVGSLLRLMPYDVVRVRLFTAVAFDCISARQNKG